ncbi:hypothetical protein CHS0354_035468 [Potamilus streckersoni]|uniref:F5/8 type C domain-containing protein n=1 Tax=Potamilus streckersoni TaxID=2493646 RepID=A0AAE0VJY8_9BIVA|nr:hypothetical protein CHS0354_035468 [Potamilus streckersoni]
MRQPLLLSLIFMCYGYLKQDNQCDSQTGKCLSDVQCDPGWMGSGCQQVNIAYNVSVISYHSDQGLNVVDGRESTCATFTSQSGEPAFLVLDLGRKVNILEVDLINPNASGDSLQKFGISLSQDNVTFKPYYWYQRTSFPVITETSLKSDIITRFVRIEPNGTEHISTLCEIEITGECENFYGNCSTPCGHCASGEQCNKVTGYCDVSGCADGWQTVKCNKHKSASKEPVNVGIIAGSVCAVVAVIIVFVLSVVIMKTRRLVIQFKHLIRHVIITTVLYRRDGCECDIWLEGDTT